MTYAVPQATRTRLAAQYEGRQSWRKRAPLLQVGHDVAAAQRSRPDVDDDGAGLVGGPEGETVAGRWALDVRVDDGCAERRVARLEQRRAVDRRDVLE